MTRKDYENCIFNLFVQTIIEPISDIKKNIEILLEENHGHNYYDILRKLMSVMDDNELIQYYDSIMHYFKMTGRIKE